MVSHGMSKDQEYYLADAYLQIKLDENSKQLVVLNTHQGLYYYKRMPFGLSYCATAIFERIIKQTVADILGVACYLDDIIIKGKTEKDHINLQKTLERLKEWIPTMQE